MGLRGVGWEHAATIAAVMGARFEHPGRQTVALAYDELPAGSTLRRQFDGQGGVTITAPAGEVSESVRQQVSRAALLPAAVAFVSCVSVIGPIVLHQIRINRIDPQLRSAALLMLGVLATGVFLFVWLIRRSSLWNAVADARRRASILHVTAERMLVEVASPTGEESLELAVSQMLALKVGPAALDATGTSAAVLCLQVLLRDGRTSLLLGGHHPVELGWVAAAVSETTGVPVVTRVPRRTHGANA